MTATLTPIAVAMPKVAPRKTVVFSGNFELLFDTGGAHENPSGTSGHNPNVHSVVLRNTTVAGLKVSTKAADDEIAAAAEVSEAALIAAVRKHYKPAASARRAWNSCLDLDQYGE